MVDRAGFEPATSRVRVGRSYQLNYRPIIRSSIELMANVIIFVSVNALDRITKKHQIDDFRVKGLSH